MASSVCLYGLVLRKEDGHIFRRALDFEVEGKRINGRQKRTWMRQVEDESVKVGVSREIHRADQSGLPVFIRLPLD